MPYHARGSWVMVKRGDRWVAWKKAANPERAKRWAAKLNMLLHAGKAK